MAVQKMQVVVQKMQVEIKTKLVTFVTDNVLLVGIVGNKNLLARMLQDKEAVRPHRERKHVHSKAAMKRCALCHGRLGLGTRFRNVWNGRWWAHVRFCSVRCEGIYEVRRNEAAKHRWHTFLAHSNSRS